jgi:hypothetical protein
MVCALERSISKNHRITIIDELRGFCGLPFFETGKLTDFYAIYPAGLKIVSLGGHSPQEPTGGDPGEPAAAVVFSTVHPSDEHTRDF